MIDNELFARLPPDEMRALVSTAAAGGHQSYWEARLRMLDLPGPSAPPFVTTVAYAALGRSEEAFALIERALDTHNGQMIFLGVHPGLRPLHGDPRFERAVARLGLPVALSSRAEPQPLLVHVIGL